MYLPFLLCLARGEPYAARWRSAVLFEIPRSLRISEMVGITRSHVNFFMNQFKKPGTIDDDGVLQVNSRLLGIDCTSDVCGRIGGRRR